jgi:hypothetical protein
MAGDLKFGAVLFWKGFRFPDGGSSDKLLIVLGAKQGHDMIAVLCTSQPRHGKLTEGCHSDLGYYFVPKGRHGHPKDTWVQLYRIVILSAADAVKAAFAAELRVQANLPADLAAGIRNCLKATKDISAAEIALLE